MFSKKFGPIFVLALFCLSTTTAGKISSKRYIDTAESILDKIPVVESVQDATCWSTVRMMESFYAEKPLSELASILKIEISTNLTFKLWQQLSIQAKGEYITSQDVLTYTKTYFPEAESASGQIFYDIIEKKSKKMAIPMTHYHRTTEHFRSLLAIIYGIFTEDSFYYSQKNTIKPLKKNAIDDMIKLITAINMRLIKEAKQLSDQLHEEKISSSAMKKTFKRMRKKPAYTKKTPKQWQIHWDIHHKKETLRALTLKNIDNKIQALKAKNKAFWKDDTVTSFDALNIVSKHNLTKKEFENLKNRVFAYFLLNLFQDIPVRFHTVGPTNSLGFNGYLLNPEWDKEAPNRDYLDLMNTLYLTHNFIPVSLHQNGDVSISYIELFGKRIDPGINPENNSENNSENKKEHQNKTSFKNWMIKKEINNIRQVKMENYFTDAVRDSTVHWELLKRILKENKHTNMDVFSQELITERVSELISLFLYERNAEPGNIFRKLLKSEDPIFSKIRFINEKKESNESIKNDASIRNKTVFNWRKKSIEDTQMSASSNTENTRSLLQKFGYGLASEDLNQDGLPEILISNETSIQLYVNLGGFKFKNITPDSGLDIPLPMPRQIVVTDINNDGSQDIVVGNKGPLAVFVNNGNMRFSRRDMVNDSDTTSTNTLVLFDYNNDTLLDMYLGRSNNNLSKIFLNGRGDVDNSLFKNTGSQFEAVSGENGIIPASDKMALAVSAFDYNQDGFQDLHVVNDFSYDDFYQNNAGKSFEEVSYRLGINDRGNGMNSTIMDINNDLKWDVYVSIIDMFNKNITFTMPTDQSLYSLDERILYASSYLVGNKLFVATENGFIADEMRYFKTYKNVGISWAADFFDVENDGDLDLSIATGFFINEPELPQQNLFYINENNTFKENAPNDLESFNGNSRNIISTDLNNDGKLDLLIYNLDGSLRVLENKVKKPGNWIKIKLTSNHHNRDCIGASIIVKTKTLKPQMRLVTNSTNFFSSKEKMQHVGIGKNRVVDSVTVRWPDGITQEITGPIKANKSWLITYKKTGAILTKL